MSATEPVDASPLPALPEVSEWAVSGGRVYYAIKRCLLFYPLFTGALSNVMCLHTLRHVTSMKNVISINRVGADPHLGRHFAAQWSVHEARFYVVRDKDFSIDNCVATALIKRLAPIEYKVKAEEFGVTSCKFTAIFKGFFNPTLEFYFNEVHQFEDDRRLPGLGMTTTSKIDVDHLGIQGIIKYGANDKWKERFSQNPGQFIIGIIQMLVCLILLPLAIVSLPLVALGQCAKIDRF